MICTQWRNQHRCNQSFNQLISNLTWLVIKSTYQDNKLNKMSHEACVHGYAVLLSVLSFLLRSISASCTFYKHPFQQHRTALFSRQSSGWRIFIFNEFFYETAFDQGFPYDLKCSMKTMMKNIFLNHLYLLL